MAVINNLLVKQYAVCIYIHGTREFDTVINDYKEQIKQHAAQNYTLMQIDNALVCNNITEQEYQETIAYMQTLLDNENK